MYICFMKKKRIKLQAQTVAEYLFPHLLQQSHCKSGSSGNYFCFTNTRSAIKKLQLISLFRPLACYDCISFPARKI